MKKIRNWMNLALPDIKYLSQAITVIKTEEYPTGINWQLNKHLKTTRPF